MSHRESTRKALMGFFKREARKSMRRTRKNEKPEFEFKKLVKKWLDCNGWACDVVESRAVYNFAAGRYDHGQTEPGFSDIVGVTPYFGVAAYIELKAPGRRSALKPHQHAFLVEKISRNAFACCTDSIEHLSGLFERWRDLRSHGKLALAFQLLVDDLPNVKAMTDNLADITG